MGKKQVADMKNKQERSEWDQKCNRFLNSANAALERAKAQSKKATDKEALKLEDAYKQELENFKNQQDAGPTRIRRNSTVPTLKAEADHLQSLLKKKLGDSEPKSGSAPHLQVPVLPSSMMTLNTRTYETPVHDAEGNAPQRRQKHAAVLDVGAGDAAVAAHAAIAAAAAAGTAETSGTAGPAGSVSRRQLPGRNMMGGFEAVHQRNQPISLIPKANGSGKHLRSTSQVLLTRDPAKPSQHNPGVQMPITSFSSSSLQTQNVKKQSSSFENRKLGYLQQYAN